uniref:Phosphopantothenoylcysteine decarboxylase n=1 Tax=Taeniopygia guttata TaxID=59729 RepID=A0A674HML3_TAEGU|nr:phosphopantothenoylcysteine decarboxylase isoform X2 [Taeniopygia guttata]
MVRKFGACYESYLSRSLSLWKPLVCCTETLCYGLTCTEVFPFAWQLEVKVVTTERAKHFYNAQEIPVTLYGDEEEWQLWKGRSDPVLHIELRRWADLMVVAPLDANTLGKVANGICDNLLTCVIRAWDLSKPLLFCPAMNTAMWEHPITAHQVEQLKGFGYTEIPCVVKKLVCGDEGRGAMAEVWTIVERVKRILEERDVPRQS